MNGGTQRSCYRRASPDHGDDPEVHSPATSQASSGAIPQSLEALSPGHIPEPYDPKATATSSAMMAGQFAVAVSRHAGTRGPSAA